MNHGPAGSPHTGGDPDTLDGRRILALHAATLVLVALLTDFEVACRKPYYMGAVLILFLLTFFGTLASARYHGEWKIF
jgi:multisubunit Na+/H+ antiporter MnhF subunit